MYNKYSYKKYLKMFKNVLTNASIYDNIYLSAGNGWQIIKRGV